MPAGEFVGGEEAPRAPARPAWSEFRRALEERGFRPSRRLGQNFLRDGNMARAIVRDARVLAGDFVLEVGPGCGFLTLHLAALGARVLAIEIDPRLLEVARELLTPWPNVRFVLGDALAGKHALSPGLLDALPRSGPWHVVSNLPYAAGTPILALCARLPNPPASMTCLVQRELAERITASPGGREWGALAVRMQTAYLCELVRPVPPDLFWPRPKVESSLLRLELREARPGAEELARLDGLLELLFRQRRKSVGGLLASRLGGREAAERLLGSLGIRPDARPERLETESLLAIVRSPDWFESA